MDLTEKYRVMLRGAPEIQEQWELSPGDYLQRASFIGVYSGSQYAYSTDIGVDMEQRFIHTHDWDIIRPQYLWLPRQDQLQDMSIVPHTHKDYPDIMHKMDALNRWMHHYKPRTYQYTTGEQLWLAFIMHKNYKKIWNGKEWKRIK